MGSLLCCRNKAGQRTVTTPQLTTPHRLITKNEMGKFDGSFKLECQSNLAAAFKAMGVPDADTKRYLDPKNSVVYTITEKSDGSFETKSTISEMPEWNQTSCFKLGERLELKTPFEHAATMTKTDENTFCMKTEMGGKVMESSMQHHNYGISISGCIDGVCFSEEFKKMEPKFSGFYKFESETGMGPLMEAMGISADGLSAADMVNMGFRVVDKGCKIWLEEHYGDKKEYMAVLNQEYDYERPEWNWGPPGITTGPDPPRVSSTAWSATGGSPHWWRPSQQPDWQRRPSTTSGPSPSSPRPTTPSPRSPATSWPVCWRTSPPGKTVKLYKGEKSYDN